MYDKYTARPAVFLSCNFIEFSPFYSALNIVFGAPAGYCVPVGLMVTFKGGGIFLFFRRYLRFRGVCSCVFLNIVI